MADTIYSISNVLNYGGIAYISTEPTIQESPGKIKINLSKLNDYNYISPDSNVIFVTSITSKTLYKAGYTHMKYGELQKDKVMIVRLALSSTGTSTTMFFVGYEETSNPLQKPLLIKGEKVKSLTFNSKKFKDFTLSGKTYIFH